MWNRGVAIDEGWPVIIEGILTTDAGDGPHLATMGPVVDRELAQWVLRPYPTSTTCGLLKQNPKCTFHVIDDVLLMAQLVVRKLPAVACRRWRGHWILESACRWYALEAVQWTDGHPCEVRCEVVERRSLRDFWGWNRAKHAVLEAAILCTRLHLLDRQQVADDLRRLEVPVNKTGGKQELAAWQLLDEYVRSWNGG